MKMKTTSIGIIAFALILASNTFECFAGYNVEATEKLKKLIHDNLASTQLDQIQLLVEEGADINVANSKSGKTLLWIACQNRHLKTVQFLLKSGGQVDKADNDGATPLLIASQEGHLEIVRLLLENGAKVDKATNDGVTPLKMASQNSHLEIVRLLVRKGAQVDKATN